ncbi:alkaline phosphatase family protein [Streptomyces sp. NPDC057543]|uniref:alkaline phosphatase family protein n=1 Tax=Streptomyces sp. NPDC057543 TaxID=3346163 RepID=UPI0036C3D52D
MSTSGADGSTSPSARLPRPVVHLRTHLDYDLQWYGPDSHRAVRGARETDAALAPFLGDLRDRGTTVVALGQYGINPVSRPVDINRALRRKGLLFVYSRRGMEYLAPCTSRAFAVADHRAARAYVADPADIPRVRDVLRHTEGVDEIWDRTEQAPSGIDHPDAGEPAAAVAAQVQRRRSASAYRRAPGQLPQTAPK